MDFLMNLVDINPRKASPIIGPYVPKFTRFGELPDADTLTAAVNSNTTNR